MNRIKAGSLILLIFFLGVLSGAAGMDLYIKHRISSFFERGHKGRTEALLKRMSQTLDLTPLQQAEIEEILQISQAEVREINQRCRPQIKSVMDRSFQLIREKLNDDQKPKFDLFLKDMHKHHRNRFIPPPPMVEKD